MKKRAKIEWFKAKVAFILTFTFMASADSGVVFMVLTVLSAFWLLICSKRLEKMGELDD